MTNYLDLLDWRRRIAELYVELRRRPPNETTLTWFRAEKDALWRGHPQSPLPAEERGEFEGLAYWPFDPAARMEASFVPVEEIEIQIPVSTLDEIAMVQVGRLEFTYGTEACALDAFWVNGYGSGLFVPFRDGTSGKETYGSGRYLLDTVKSIDLGSDSAASTVVLDFNYAFHPSCAFDQQWACPLAPPQNWLTVAIRAGERSLV